MIEVDASEIVNDVIELELNADSDSEQEQNMDIFKEQNFDKSRKKSKMLPFKKMST